MFPPLPVFSVPVELLQRITASASICPLKPIKILLCAWYNTGIQQCQQGANSGTTQGKHRANSGKHESNSGPTLEKRRDNMGPIQGQHGANLRKCDWLRGNISAVLRCSLQHFCLFDTTQGRIKARPGQQRSNSWLTKGKHGVNSGTTVTQLKTNWRENF